MTGDDFEEAVRRIQTYIGQGDVFQVNLSVRQSKALSVSHQLHIMRHYVRLILRRTWHLFNRLSLQLYQDLQSY